MIEYIQPIIQQLISDTPLAGPAAGGQKVHALTALDAWSRSSTDVRWHCPRQDFTARLALLINEPWRVNQGSYDVCMLAAILNTLLRRFPDKVVDFATHLYDTGELKLGDWRKTLAPELVSFDLPAYVRGEIPEHPLPADRCPPGADVVGKRPIVYAHADWIMMSAMLDASNAVIDFEGPLDDSGASGPASAGSGESILEKTKFYSDVSTVDFNGHETVQTVLTKLGAAPDRDIILVGLVSFFAKDAGVTNLGRHAAALVNLPVNEAGDIKLAFQSFGDAPVTIDMPPAIGGHPVTVNASNFGPAPVSDIDGAIIARV